MTDDRYNSEVLPTVRLIDERERAEREQSYRLAPLLRAFRPEGYHCAVYTSPERWNDDRCGPWYRESGREPFPEGFVMQDGTRVAWTISRGSDGLWRPLASDLCAFTLTDEQIDRFVQERGWQVAQDEATGEVVLLDENGDRPIVSMDDWNGECSRCGLCCYAPRLSTQRGCTALRPGAPP